MLYFMIYHGIYKNSFNYLTNSQSSKVNSFLKCSFKISIAFLFITETNLSSIVICLPAVICDEPFNLIATDPLIALASFILFLFNSIVSTIPILVLPSSYMHKGVPYFNTPYTTSTPIIRGSFVLKNLTGFNTQGNIASWASLSFLSSFIFETKSINLSNRLYIMSASNILIWFSSANLTASGSTLISNTSIQAYSFFLLAGSSNKTFFNAFITSSFETGPTLTYETGILLLFKNYKRASNDPKVDAATPTP